MNSNFTSQLSLTDWARVDALRDQDIDFSDCPEITPEMFAHAKIRKGLRPVEREVLLTLKLEPEVLAWFKAQNPSYQAYIGAVLRAYKEAHEKPQ